MPVLSGGAFRWRRSGRGSLSLVSSETNRLVTRCRGRAFGGVGRVSRDHKGALWFQFAACNGFLICLLCLSGSPVKS